MGTRVRKLAKELGGTPGEVLGLLQELGQDRYRSPEDMLSTAIVAQVTRAWEKGRRGTPVPLPEPAPPPRKAVAASVDFMAQLVPGVVRTGAKPAKRSVPPPSPDAPVEAIAAPPPAEASLAAQKRALERSVARDRAALDAARVEIETQRAEAARMRAELEAARAELRVAWDAVETDRQALAEAREAFAAEQVAAAGRVRPGLAELLSERGLRGADEFERAVAGLASTRRLRDLVPFLEVGDTVAARAVLVRGLVLVGGEVPEALGTSVAGIQVAPERGEMPGWAELRKELGRASEMLMVHGLRYVVIVGTPPFWHRLIRDSFDPRLDLRFGAGIDEGNGDRRVDAVIAVDGNGGKPDPSARPLVVRVRAPDLVGFARAVRDALADA